MPFSPYTPLSNIRMFDTVQQGGSPHQAPKFTVHRKQLAAVDGAGAIADRRLGMNMAGFEYAVVRVVPSWTGGSPSPNIEVLFWSEEAGAFIQEATTISQAAPAAKTPYDLRVPVRGRIIFVKVTGTIVGASGDRVDVLVAGDQLDRGR